MIGVGSALVSLLLIFVCYSLTLTAKRADENLLMICEKNQKNEEERGNREMESQRDILRVIEKEIKKKRKCASCICRFGGFRGMLSFGR